MSKGLSIGDLGGWSFLQSLANTSCSNENDQVFVHPLVKRSSSSLSIKSLEMCTESLGSETGCDIGENSGEFTSPALREESCAHGGQRAKSPGHSKRPYNEGGFPPPLSSMNGSERVRVRPHREGGRLVIKAVVVSSCFRRERVNGRLKLSVWKDDCSNEETEINIESEEAEAVGHESVGDGDGEAGETVCDDKEEACCWVEEGDDEVVLSNDCWCESMEGNDESGVGYKIEAAEGLPRPSRCKEDENGRKGMPSWGPFCVAIS